MLLSQDEIKHKRFRDFVKMFKIDFSGSDLTNSPELLTVFNVYFMNFKIYLFKKCRHKINCILVKFLNCNAFSSQNNWKSKTGIGRNENHSE